MIAVDRERGLPADFYGPLRPTNGRVLVRTEEIEIQYQGIVLFAQTMLDRPVQGRVLAAPEDSEVEVGDTVLVARLGGELLCQDGTTWDAMYEREEVLAVIEKVGGQSGIL